MSEIHFIGGEKGGVGKSVVARLLAQYWIDREQLWKGYDGDLSHGALLRHYGDYAEALDIEQLEDLDQLIEHAATEPDGRLLVDLPAQSERHVHAWLESADVPALTAELEVGLRLWHVMDDGKDSLRLLERLLGRYGDQVGYVVVLNRGRGNDFELFERSSLGEQLEELQAPVLQLRALYAPTMRKIDRLDKSYWGAIHNRGEPEDSLGLMERQRMKVWLKHAYGEFERAGILENADLIAFPVRGRMPRHSDSPIPPTSIGTGVGAAFKLNRHQPQRSIPAPGAALRTARSCRRP